MTIYNIDATEFTPSVLLNHEKHLIEFVGESRPENINHFFDPINKWIEEYGPYVFYLESINESAINIVVNFKLEYFNSSTAKKLLDVLEKLSIISKKATKINLTINWFYDVEDEDMLDTGQEYEKLAGLKFNIIPNN